jgi:hypothetical protein
MSVVCAWCGATIGYDDLVRPVSHGICEKCGRTVHFQEGVPLQEFLDALEAPVLAVDSDVLVKVANRRARTLLKKDDADIVDRRGGDVFACTHARLPGGCGKTVHCSGCTIRRTVMETDQTGRAFLQVPAYLRQGQPGSENEICLYVSTEKVGDVVLLRIDRIGESGRK